MHRSIIEILKDSRPSLFVLVLHLVKKVYGRIGLSKSISGRVLLSFEIIPRQNVKRDVANFSEREADML